MASISNAHAMESNPSWWKPIYNLFS